MSKSWNDHCAPYIRKYMKKALAEAKRSWRGSKKPSPAKQKQIASLQKKRAEINRKIKHYKSGGK